MNDEIFAEMFERYVKTTRGIAFLNNYLATALAHVEVEQTDDECCGVQHTISLPVDADEKIMADLEK